MAYLIEVDEKSIGKGLSFTAVIVDLENAWHTLAVLYLEALSKVRQSQEVTLAGIRDSLPRVQLPRAPQESQTPTCGLPAEGEWELSEVHRQLCQVGVLIEAIKLVAIKHNRGSIVGLSPTQQSGSDARGTDDNGAVWVLEAFGGGNVRNNKKAHKDAKALCREPGVAHRYFACFREAWKNYYCAKYEFEIIGESESEPIVQLISVKSQQPPSRAIM